MPIETYVISSNTLIKIFTIKSLFYHVFLNDFKILVIVSIDSLKNKRDVSERKKYFPILLTNAVDFLCLIVLLVVSHNL